MIKHLKEDKSMNIQQLRYVVAIANSGTFREAAEKMYVSQPSLSIAVRDLEKPALWFLTASDNGIC